MRHIGLSIALLLSLICSCNNHKQVMVFNPHELTKTVIWIDSLNNEIISQSLDEIPDIINPETGLSYGNKEIKQSRLKENKDWKKFVKYIRRQKYDKAAEYIKDTEVRGSILGHLRQSELRSAFIIDVVEKLLMLCDNHVYFLVYTQWLYAEIQNELSIYGISNGEPHDVPQSFTSLIVTYGINLSSAGYLSNALELVPIYNLANTYFNPVDDLWQQFQKAYFENTLYHVAGDAATADSILLDFKNNVTPKYGARGKDAARDVDEIIAYWEDI